MKKIGIVAGLLLAAVPFFVYGYVSPGKPSGFVNDFASIISVEQKNQLENTLSDFKKRTGTEIAVVTIPSLGDESIESYAVKLFEEWGIGQKGKDNGLLLLVAVQERKMRIEVGYGLEPYITDAQASSIIRNILTPAFKEGKYGEGISEAVSTMIKVLDGQGEAVSVDSGEGGIKTDIGSIVIFIFFVIPFLLGTMARTKSWWFGGAYGLLIGFILFGFYSISLIFIPLFVILGFIIDYILSKLFADAFKRGDMRRPPWWLGGGGGRGGSGGGGFGGFGGGGSGGGGSSGGW